MERIRHRADFLAAAGGKRASAPAFLLQCRERDDRGPARVGFTVTRKIGNAVERNRIRRRLREVIRLGAALPDRLHLRPHHDYVLIGRRAALSRDFTDLMADLHAVLGRLARQSGASSSTQANRPETT